MCAMIPPSKAAHSILSVHYCVRARDEHKTCVYLLCAVVMGVCVHIIAIYQSYNTDGKVCKLPYI